MSTRSAGELEQTMMRTSSLFKDAERLLDECRDRHIWCTKPHLCKSHLVCCQRWNKLARDNDAFFLPMSEYNTFRRDLKRMEQEGYPLSHAEYGRIAAQMLVVFMLASACLLVVVYTMVLDAVV